MGGVQNTARWFGRDLEIEARRRLSGQHTEDIFWIGKRRTFLRGRDFQVEPETQAEECVETAHGESEHARIQAS